MGSRTDRRVGSLVFYGQLGSGCRPRPRGQPLDVKMANERVNLSRIHEIAADGLAGQSGYDPPGVRAVRIKKRHPARSLRKWRPAVQPGQTQSKSVKAGPAARHPRPETRNPGPQRGSNPVKPLSGQLGPVKAVPAVISTRPPRLQTQDPNKGSRSVKVYVGGLPGG